MAGKKGRSGRPLFVPTDEQRNTVKVMAALGIPHDKICLTVRNPDTGKPISRPTMEKVFRKEIDTAQTELHARIGSFIVMSILGQKQPIGEVIRSERVRMRLAMFYAKTQMGWCEPIVNEPADQNKQPINEQNEEQNELNERDLKEKIEAHHAQLYQIAQRLLGGTA
jgi:hypothetical protein